MPVGLLNEFRGLLGEAYIPAPLVWRHRRSSVLDGVVPVGFGSDPAGEAKGVEPVGCLVEFFLDRIAGARFGIEAHQRLVRAGDQHVGVRDVPLADPEGEVSRCAEIVAERRHAVGVDPEDVRVAGFLGRRKGLAGPVERRVVAGQDGCPRRHAGGGHDIVMLEVQPAGEQRVLEFEMRFAELPGEVRLVRRQEAHLVAQDDQDVGAFASFGRGRCLAGCGYAVAALPWPLGSARTAVAAVARPPCRKRRRLNVLP